MRITWLGNAVIRLETAEEKMIFDPFVELPGAEHPNLISDFYADETVFLTHGHFDHAYFIPDLLDACEDMTVYCTEGPAETISKYTERSEQIVCIRAGQTLSFGNVRVRARFGQHVRIDRKLKLRTFLSPRTIKYFRNFRFCLYASRRFKEFGETLAYEIQAEGKTILLLGSLGLNDAESYPKHADLLILPFQGSSCLEEIAMDIIRRLEPKRILLTHFDDAFPPFSNTVSTKKLHRLLSENYPSIKTVKPEPYHPIDI